MNTRFIITLGCILVSLGISFGKEAGEITHPPANVTPLLFLQSADEDDWDDDWEDSDVSEKEADSDSLPPAAEWTIKLRNIILPTLSLEEAKIGDVMEYLERKAFELDRIHKEGAKRGVTITVDATVKNRIIRKMDFNNASLFEIIRKICKETNLFYDFTPNGLRIYVPKEELPDDPFA